MKNTLNWIRAAPNPYLRRHHMEKMTVIINIQTMEKAIGSINPISFEALWQTDLESLREIQDNFIKQYNQAIRGGPQT
jgi:hypothetical protein